MASDYEAISKENQARYGTDIGRIGPMLLVDRYDDRTHFIFELLQNAEDALGRRATNDGERGVKFELSPNKLVLSHHGKPFDEADVRGVCGIAESTKDKFSIGRFGIGFKSVYTFTDLPEIHSGDQDFVVQNYVWPRQASRMERGEAETQIVLPFKPSDHTAQKEITDGFQRLGPGSLLFLRHINDISWKVADGASGVYLRSDPKPLDAHVQHISVVGQESGKPDFEQEWLVFQRDVCAPGEVTVVGRVEIAFSLRDSSGPLAQWSVQPVTQSPLVVFFPTVVQTNLGFLVQGPYRTTPSRDNIPRGEPWNQHLVSETAILVVEAMRWIRDHVKLDTSALRSLPLVRERFQDRDTFAPIFESVRKAFMDEPLLPRFGGGYIKANQARLARTAELRELFTAEQLATIYGVESCAWLTGDITTDREPEIRSYLIRELNIPEIVPQTLIARLSGEFLEAQTDEWILRLYEFLAGQEAALRARLDSIPLLRLNDGTHVVVREDGPAKAFLPGSIETGFPTMRRQVCASPEVRAFLMSLGIKEPDPVDDVVWNVLPKYRHEHISVGDDEYAADMERILKAFGTDSKAQRDKLLSALNETTFVKVVDAGDGAKYVAKPGDAYLATDRLRQLFAGVAEVFLVDDDYDCLRGESMRELLEACGALRYPRPVDAPNALTAEERRELRKQTGYELTSGFNDRISDRELEGFEQLLALLPSLSVEERVERARLMWESLGDLEERRGRNMFDGSYSWTYYGDRRTPPFPAAFVRRLNKAAWIPDPSGALVRPSLIVFDTLGWRNNPFLLTKIVYKPPVLDQLAIEAGIEPGAIDLLRRLGITSVAQLTSMLGIEDLADDEPDSELPSDLSASPTDASFHPGSPLPAAPSGGPGVNPGAGAGSPTGGQNTAGAQGGFGGSGGGHSGSHGGSGGSHSGAGAGGHGSNAAPSQGQREFVSYVAVGANENDDDPDGLAHASRMEMEEHAYKRIIAQESSLKRAPPGNPGFDLYEDNADGRVVRWIEVKSMKGSLQDRPVTLSSVQFECAQKYKSAFWLYVVEHTLDDANARILRIQDPAGNARTFTFDRGWAHVAKTDAV